MSANKTTYCFPNTQLCEKWSVNNYVIDQPLRQLEVKNMADDFYSNLIDWAGNKTYYAVDRSVFYYDFHADSVSKLYESNTDQITAVKYNKWCNTLVMGTSTGFIKYLDLETEKVAEYPYHRSRIGVMETYTNQIISGSRDRKIKIIDIRAKNIANRFYSHTQEVCGLALNCEWRYLASGGNDNKVYVHDLREPYVPYAKYSEHTAAVKALSWSQQKSSHLVTGGGTADKTIRHWDVFAAAPLLGAYTFEGQVCNLHWLKNNSIISTFGYTNDDIKLLKNFKTVKRFVGHKNRVIHFAVEETENYFVSGSGDSTMKFWEIGDASVNDDIRMR
ncbi:cell division cycle 20-like protein 1, cofactor of APC complex [Enteropsectra breve]|nr:cell division cycle 20-like protein 1, cofactor of APC complex [Enteropsectra breve]